MASFLNTDIGDLVSQWQEKAAINEQTALFEEAYERARLNSIRSAGAEAFRSGMSLEDAKAGYRENLELQAAEKQYPLGDVSDSGAFDFVDDLGVVDDLGGVDEPFSHDDEDGESYNIGSSDVAEGDGSNIDISILFNTPQVYN